MTGTHGTFPFDNESNTCGYVWNGKCQDTSWYCGWKFWIHILCFIRKEKTFKRLTTFRGAFYPLLLKVLKYRGTQCWLAWKRETKIGHIHSLYSLMQWLLKPKSWASKVKTLSLYNCLDLMKTSEQFQVHQRHHNLIIRSFYCARISCSGWMWLFVIIMWC